jgi:hypothetical protein
VRVAALAILSLLSGPALADSESEWVPDAASVARADTAAMRIDLPKEFGPVGTYFRFYWGSARHGHHLIEGLLVSPSAERWNWNAPTQKVNIIREDAVPVFADGGCMFVNVEFDVEAEALTDSSCSFDLRPPPSPQGGH